MKLFREFSVYQGKYLSNLIVTLFLFPDIDCFSILGDAFKINEKRRGAPTQNK